MGKSIKGKELGVGISQRKDGVYTGRYTDKNGKRVQKYFGKLAECRAWMAEAQFRDEHGGIDASGDMTVEAWFKYWLDEIKGDNIKPNTRKAYTDRYAYNVHDVIGHMLLSEVKPLHCQHVLNRMANKYGHATIECARTLMFGLFDCAAENNLILKNPVTRAVKCSGGYEPKARRALTLEEQRLFLEAARESRYFLQYAFILQTGLRVGEMSGLKWNDVDMGKRMIHVRRTIGYDYRAGKWISGAPKSKAGVRDVPLTGEALDILKTQRGKNKAVQVMPMEFAESVFLSQHGELICASMYDSDVKRCCNRAGIERISMHVLRHTFATRCIESGMRPKTLQTILGHSNISMTMDLYVHVTEDEKACEMEYIRAKSMHAGESADDKAARVKKLEEYMDELNEDLKELMGDMIPEEKSVVKQKITKLGTLI